MISIFKNVKVECFSGDTEMRLETQVNKWLAENEFNIIDIKFSSAACTDESRVYYDYSALIVYTE